MSILAEFYISAADFIMNRVTENVPEMRIEIARVAVEDENVTPYFWAANGDFEQFEDALSEDPTISDYKLLQEDTNECFYRVTWKHEQHGIVPSLGKSDAMILKATSEDEDWVVEMYFPDDASLSSFQEYLTAHDISADVGYLYHSTHPEDIGRFEVTEEQREALVAAHRNGYYEIPSEITLRELADELSISENAVSERLKRGNKNLVKNTLIHNE